MGQIVTLNKPSDLEKLGGVLQGAGSAAWGMEDAKQLLEQLQQEREKHDFEMTAGKQALREARRQSERDFEDQEWEREDRATSQQYEQNAQQAMGQLGPGFEIAKYMDPKDPRTKLFIEDEQRRAKSQVVSDAAGKRKAELDRGAQPTARGMDPLFQPEQTQAWQAHLDEIAMLAEADPEKAAGMLDEIGTAIDKHAETVATERARVMNASKVLPKAELFIDTMEAQGSDPDGIFRARVLLETADVKNMDPKELQDTIKQAMAAASGFDVPGAGTQPKAEKDPRDIMFEQNSKVLELAYKDPNWELADEAGKAAILKSTEGYLTGGRTGGGNQIPFERGQSSSGGAEQTPGSQAAAVSPGESPAAPSQQMNGKAAASPEERIMARFKELKIDPNTPVDQLTPEQRKALGLEEPKKKGLTRKREDAPGRNQ